MTQKGKSLLRLREAIAEETIPICDIFYRLKFENFEIIADHHKSSQIIGEGACPSSVLRRLARTKAQSSPHMGVTRTFFNEKKKKTRPGKSWVQNIELGLPATK